MLYNDHRKTLEKTARNESFSSCALQTFRGKSPRCLVLDGSRLRTCRHLISAGVQPQDITVIERDVETTFLQRKMRLGVHIVKSELSSWIRNTRDQFDSIYLDGMGCWTGNASGHLLSDVSTLLERAWGSGQGKLVLALTFVARCNYNRRGHDYKQDVIDAIRSTKRFSKSGKNDSWSTDKLIRHMLDKTFDYTGWSVERHNWRNEEKTQYRKQEKGSSMLFYRYTLRRRNVQNRAVRWPVVDSEIPGFGGGWDLHNVEDV